MRETRVNIYENKKRIRICDSISFSVINDKIIFSDTHIFLMITSLQILLLQKNVNVINYVLYLRIDSTCGGGKKFNKIWIYYADDARQNAQENIAQ